MPETGGIRRSCGCLYHARLRRRIHMRYLPRVRPRQSGAHAIRTDSKGSDCRHSLRDYGDAVHHGLLPRRSRAALRLRRLPGSRRVVVKGTDVTPETCILDDKATSKEIQDYIDGFHPNQAFLQETGYAFPRKYTVDSWGMTLLVNPERKYYIRVKSHLGCIYTGTGRTLEHAAVEVMLSKAERGLCDNEACSLHPRTE